MRIYISSTYSDLKKYREAVYGVLHKMGLEVIAMEDYVALDDRPLQKCLADIEKCDVYIGIFAWRYGTIPGKRDLSITELEYKHAKENDIPCLIFLLDDNAQWLPRYMDSHTGDGKQGVQISRLRNELKSEKVVSFFNNEIELGAEAALSLYKIATKTKSFKEIKGWEYFFTIDLLKDGLKEIQKKYKELDNDLIYRPAKIIKDEDVLDWLKAKTDDLIALLSLFKVSISEELMVAFGEPGIAGDKGKIEDAVNKIIVGCKGLLDWEVDLKFSSLSTKFSILKELMQGWTKDYVNTISKLHDDIEKIVTDPNSKGTFNIVAQFDAPSNLGELIPTYKRIMNIT